MKRITALILAIFMMLTLAGCQQSTAGTAASHTPDRCQIGVSLPDKSFPHWERDGGDIKKRLEAKGYTVGLLYADNDQSTQIKQVEELIARGCKVLIITCIDGNSMGSVLAKAKEAGVTIICYDRQVDDAEHVDYCVSFDIFRYGAVQGEYIEAALGLKDGKGPFNIEVFAGDRGDANMIFFFEGGMSILRPYIESGRLVVKSGQVDWMDAYTDGYKTENAKARMDDLLAKYYTKDKLDAVFALNDSIALGVIAALDDAGYTKFPIITGNDCDKPNVIAMKAGKQSMSAFRDSHILTAKVVEMADEVMTGREVPFTANTTHTSGGRKYTVGMRGIPTFLCDPAVVTIDNIQKILIDGGYYTEADLEE